MWCGFRPEAVKHSCPDHLTLLREKEKMSVKSIAPSHHSEDAGCADDPPLLLCREGSDPSS